jgi:AraC family transcriptional activator of pobA
MQLFDSEPQTCRKRMKPARIATYDIASFGTEVTSRNFDFGRLEDRRHAPMPMPHRHSFYQIVWMTDGAGAHVIDSQIFSIKAGAIFFLSPGRVHAWDLRGGHGYVFNFNADFVYASLQLEDAGEWFSRLHQPEDVPVLYVDSHQSAVLLDIVGKLEHEYQGNASGRISALQAYFQLLLIQLDRYRSVSRAHPILNRSAALVQKFRLLIDQNFCRRLSVHDYSLLLNVTECHLSDVTKRVTGMTAGQLVQERTLLEAKRLLIHNGASISEIALQLGFDDPAYFSRFFKKCAGQSPKEFQLEFEKALCTRYKRF